MLYNGYGEHNIQGIGDKHIPLIHNVMNTDLVIGVVGPQHRRARRPLQHRGRAAAISPRRRRVDPELVAALDGLGLSGIANVLARHQDGEASGARPDRT